MLPTAKDYTRAKRGLEHSFEQAIVGSDAVIETMIEGIAGVLGASSACWHRSDPASAVPVSTAVVGDPPGSFEEALQYEFDGTDVCRVRELSARRMPVAAISIETGGELMASTRFREMIAPTGAADELRVAFNDAFGTWGAAVIFTDRRMTRDDVRFVNDVLPAATTALRRAIAVEALAAASGEAAATDPGGPAVLILDAADHLIASDALARTRLELLPDDRNVHVPGVIAFLASQARHDLDGQPATARMRTLDGRWFMLDASVLGEAQEPHVAVVIQPAPASAVLDGVLRALGLSAREREVAGLVAQGRSNEAIAAALVLSPWTVQDHLKSIFEKTGVRGRSDIGVLVAGAPKPAPR